MTDPHRTDQPASVPAHASRDGRSRFGRLAPLLAFAVVAVIVELLLSGIVGINHGTFTYTLDDPYIHLALSDQIRHGNYGLFPGVHAAPSSSILFPFLLAMLSGTALHPFFPLLINIASLFWTLELVCRLFRLLKLGEDRFAIAAQAVALVVLALSFNLIGVVFTGLEHSLHIALVAASVYGLALFIEKDKVPAWLPAVLVLSPLVRYEGIALSLGCILLLALRGRVRTALSVFLAISLLVGGFSFFLVKMGLPPLPSSVLVKSAVASGGAGGLGALVRGIIKSFDFAVGHPIGLLLLLVAVFASVRFYQDASERGRRWTPNGQMALPLGCLIAGQALAGRFGWLERYEDYVLLGVFMMGVFMARNVIRRTLSSENSPLMTDRSRLAVTCGAFACLLLVGARYINNTAQVPKAASNVFLQQMQMHRFIDNFYRGPVAVNDLGLTSYHNPYPVLDLAGLGSEQARLMISRGATPAEYQAFLASKDVHLAIVYQEWFPNAIPEGWTRVGALTLTGPLVSAGEREVQFYATDRDTTARVRADLSRFRPSLPPGVVLSVF